jgi:hypothetical protein
MAPLFLYLENVIQEKGIQIKTITSDLEDLLRAYEDVINCCCIMQEALEKNNLE